jgi:hypothetical protein
MNWGGPIECMGIVIYSYEVSVKKCKGLRRPRFKSNKIIKTGEQKTNKCITDSMYWCLMYSYMFRHFELPKHVGVY